MTSNTHGFQIAVHRVTGEIRILYSVQATDAKGEIYARVAPTSFPVGAEGRKSRCEAHAAALVGDSSGCRTAKVKVAEPGQSLGDEVARLEAVRDALDGRSALASLK